ncbi:tyrosine-type recombinase/integrase [Actinoplanes sp. TFC3]|uniref:tyrosine-type recombinase/integrase n=1 Tax=Actinoplanes sp. TFC3 TaxID=1710355 RepID=UPI001F014A8E|nr:tyrosine-type recombinase/integrase [Actinoplanes sp. TFC3]
MRLRRLLPQRAQERVVWHRRPGPHGCGRTPAARERVSAGRNRNAGHHGWPSGAPYRTAAVHHAHGNPFTDRTRSAEWIKWRRKAGWPEDHSGFHALRHFFATTLFTNPSDPKKVQRALRHATLQITLETYVHFWPRRERRRGVVGKVLRQPVRDHAKSG